MKPATRFLIVLIGAVTMPMPRSIAAPGFSRSPAPSDLRNLKIAPPRSMKADTAGSICDHAQLANLSRMPALVSASVTSDAPGMNETMARNTLPGVRATGWSLIGFLPSTTVSIGKPGRMFAFSAK